MVRVTDMTHGRPIRLILLFSLPLMLGSVFQQLYTIVDTIIIGRGVGMQALASIGAADWINWLVLWGLQGFTQGFAILVAQEFGAAPRSGKSGGAGWKGEKLSAMERTRRNARQAVSPR